MQSKRVLDGCLSSRADMADTPKIFKNLSENGEKVLDIPPEIRYDDQACAGLTMSVGPEASTAMMREIAAVPVTSAEYVR